MPYALPTAIRITGITVPIIVRGVPISAISPMVQMAETITVISGKSTPLRRRNDRASEPITTRATSGMSTTRSMRMLSENITAKTGMPDTTTSFFSKPEFSRALSIPSYTMRLDSSPLLSPLSPENVTISCVAAASSDTSEPRYRSQDISFSLISDISAAVPEKSSGIREDVTIDPPSPPRYSALVKPVTDSTCGSASIVTVKAASLSRNAFS